MIAATGLRWVLTVLCALPAAYGLWRAVGPRTAGPPPQQQQPQPQSQPQPQPQGAQPEEARLPTPAGRFAHLLHALMAAAMAAMAWPTGMELPSGPQVVLFSLAAVWFPAAALLCPPPAGGSGRGVAVLRSVPHAVAMGAMAWMVHAMGSGMAEAPAGQGGMAGMPGMDMSGAAGAATMTLDGTGPRATAAVLACFFLLCALRWTARGFDTARARIPVREGRAGAHGSPYRHEWDLACHGAMALGMAVMLVVLV